jgi:hypothetical protein
MEALSSERASRTTADRPTTTTTRVPAEFVGKARAFRMAVKAEDQAFDQALALIVAPLKDRYARHPRSALRWGHIAGTERAYRLMIPPRFRLGDIIITGSMQRFGPRSRLFGVSETRIAVSWIAHEAWDPDYKEQGVSVCRFTLSFHDGRMRQDWTPIASISLHALARRYERGRSLSLPQGRSLALPQGGSDHAALMADLACLIDADPSAGQIATTDGLWLADTVLTRTRQGVVKALNVRTWVAA